MLRPMVLLLQQEPFAPQELPCFHATTIPSDFRREGRWTTPTLPPSAGSLRFLDFSFPARCLQPPREARQLHSSVASLTVAGFSKSGRLAASTLRNEAESSSHFILRLAGSPPRASPWGLLLSMPDWLHVGHLFDMMITFQITRKARLSLTHQIRNTDIEWVFILFICVYLSPSAVRISPSFSCRSVRPRVVVPPDFRFQN